MSHNELAERARAAGESVQIEWTDERERRVERAFVRRLHSERRRRAALSGVAIAASVVGAIALGRGWARPSQQRSTSAVASARPEMLRLQDGTEVTLDGADSRVETRALLPTEVTLRVTRGGASFAVAHRAERVFRVEIAGVAVQVLGTTFAVREEQGTVRVSVREGRVRVFSAARTRDLGAGESGVFPSANAVAPTAMAGVEPTAEGDEQSAPSAAPVRAAAAVQHGAHVRASAARAPQGAGTEEWRELARAGEFDRAYETLSQAGVSSVHDVPEDLLLAADAARLSRHPSEAIAPLRGVVSRHAGDPRAPLAAFTLGRVLLDELGRPREAASSFADAERLAPDGSLAEDALARQVEALGRAGESNEARAAAERYLARYPNGRRVRAVRRFGGIDP